MVASAVVEGGPDGVTLVVTPLLFDGGGEDDLAAAEPTSGLAAVPLPVGAGSAAGGPSRWGRTGELTELLSRRRQ